MTSDTLKEKLKVLKIKKNIQSLIDQGAILYKLEASAWKSVHDSGIYQNVASFDLIEMDAVREIIDSFPFVSVANLTDSLFIRLPPSITFTSDLMRVIMRGSTFINNDGTIIHIESEDSHVKRFQSSTSINPLMDLIPV